MPISVKCSKCGKVLKVKSELAGKRGKCPSCGAVIEVPSARSADAVTAGPSIPADPDGAAGQSGPSREARGRATPGSDTRRETARRPTSRRKLAVDLPLRKLGCLLGVLVAVWGIWHFGVTPFGERFRIEQVFERAFAGDLDNSLERLEAMREDISGASRDLLELRIAQVEVMGAAVEAMVQVLRAAGDRDSFVDPLDLEVLVWRAVAPDASAGPPVRLTGLKIDREDPVWFYTLAVENATERPLALRKNHFFRCQVTVETDSESGVLLQRLANVAAVANVKGNTLDGVEVPPGGRAEGVIPFFVTKPLAGPPMRDASGRRENVETMNVSAIVFSDGKTCAAVRDTTF